MRSTNLSRKTGETDITLSLNLDDSTPGKIDSGNGFLDHMLNLFQIHGGIHLDLTCKGDVYVDMHHSMEDIARLADKMVVMQAGHLRAVGTPAEIFADAQLLQETGLEPPQMMQIMQRLRAAGLPVNEHALTPEAGLQSLREVFHVK